MRREKMSDGEGGSGGGGGGSGAGRGGADLRGARHAECGEIAGVVRYVFDRVAHDRHAHVHEVRRGHVEHRLREFLRAAQHPVHA